VAKGTVRLYVVSDIHASEKAWRKMLNAARMGLYKADVVLYAGDLTGKAMVPIVPMDGGGFEAEIAGRPRRARDELELERLEQDIANLGFYVFHTTAEEMARLHSDPAALRQRFHDEIVGRVAAWMKMAAERMDGSGVPIFLIPGNDDPYDIDEALATSQYCVNVDGRVVDIPGNLQVLGSGKSNPTPWHTPREVPDDDFREELTTLADEARDPKRTIFLIH
jgi:Icc-related predicted phosphoesterase